MEKDYYSILGISRNATKQEIKNAYRKLALKFHPDKNPDDPFYEKMFLQLKEAYDALSDENERQKYDNQLTEEYQAPKKEESYKTTEREPTPNEIIITIIINLKNIANQTKGKASNQIRVEEISKYLSSILTSDMLGLYDLVSEKLKKDVIVNTIPLLRFLNLNQRNKYAIQLVKISGSDNELIKIIDQKIKIEVNKQRIRNSTNVLLRYWYVIGIILLIVIGILSNKDKSYDSNRNFDNNFENSTNRNTVVDTEPEIRSLPSKWKNNQLKTGESPYNNYFGEGIYDKNYSNEITIYNGQNTDAIVCFTEYYKPNRTIRNEYIRAGESFKMTSIPNGTYYIKSFFGKYWNPDTLIMGTVRGFFDTLAGFSKSDKYDDLIKLKQDSRQYSIYEITLYPVIGGNMESEPIDASDFFK